MSYRCRTCRNYFRDAPYQRVGLGAVCSEPCLKALSRTAPRQTPKHDIPDIVRANVLARDHYRCRYCGRPSALHIHHVHYRSEGTDHRETNLITLCGRHHQLIHSDKHHWQPICEAYIEEAQQGRLQYLPDIEKRVLRGR